MLGDGAFLSSLPFAFPLAASQAPAAAADASLLAPALDQGARLGTSGASNAATVNPANPAAARLTGERAFHPALSTSGVSDLSPTAGPSLTGSPSFAPAPAGGEASGAPDRHSRAALDARPWADARRALSPPPAAGASLSPAEAMPPSASATGRQSPRSSRSRRAGQSAREPDRSGGAGSARGGRKADAAARRPPPGLRARPSPRQAEPVDKADALRPIRPPPVGSRRARSRVWGAAVGVRRRGAVIRALRTPRRPASLRAGARLPPPRRCGRAGQGDRRRSFAERPRGRLDDDAARGRQALGRHPRRELSDHGVHRRSARRDRRPAGGDRPAARFAHYQADGRERRCECERKWSLRRRQLDGRGTPVGARRRRARELGRWEFVSARRCWRSQLLAPRLREPRDRWRASGK